MPGLSQPFIQNYTYDSLNRLSSATETNNSSQTWKQTFVFDRYGNRNFDQANTTTLGSCPVNVCNPTINAANNRLNGYGFDASGNTTADAEGRQFTYDAENKQTEVRDSLNQTVGQYFYDGDGKRVKKVVPATNETTVFVYDAAGQLVAEYSTTPSAEAKINYLTADHLGSPRINTDQSGTVTARHDYMPFGEEIFSYGGRTSGLGYAADSVRKQFTGYERDDETGLDYAQARYFSSGLGRFSSPDDFVNDTFVSDPQTWNLYVYVRNNPLRYVDPDGEERIKLGDSEEKVEKDLEEAKKRKKEIEKNKSLTKDERKKQLAEQKAKINTLKTKLEGTRIVNSILKALDKVGERNGLQLSDFELTTDGKNDFPGLDAANQEKLLNADAFTNAPGEGKTIFIRTETPDGFYRQSLANSDYIYYGASGLAHEQDHRDKPGREHSKAFERQKVVLKKFQNYYRNQALYDFNLQFVEEGVNGKYN